MEHQVLLLATTKQTLIKCERFGILRVKIQILMVKTHTHTHTFRTNLKEHGS